MFYGQCWKCGERWGLGTASTCKCPDEIHKRTWVGLTDDEIFKIHKQFDSMQYLTFGRAVEAAVREKNI